MSKHDTRSGSSLQKVLPVVMFPASVNVGEGLFVKKAHKSVLLGDISKEFLNASTSVPVRKNVFSGVGFKLHHGEHVVIAGQRRFFKDGCHLVLRWGHLIVPRHRGHTKFP